MASIDSSGIDEIVAEMKRQGELVGEVADRMLLAGAEVVKSAWRDSIRRHGLVKTGDMLESVGSPDGLKTEGGIRRINIHADGYDRHGKPNVVKAYVHNRGNSRNKATHFVDEAEKAAEAPVHAEYERIWNDFLNGRT